jgi:endonuclease/exonuclease/phosphatase family metal-dependent hydrolase
LRCLVNPKIGVCLLFCEPIRTDRHAIDFDPDQRTGRLALSVTLAVEDRPVTFINVHLAPENMDREMAALVALGDGRAEPLAILGDFNCRPGDSAMEPVRRRWNDTCGAVMSDGAREAETAGTLLNKQARVDYIFVDPNHFCVEAVGLMPATHRRISDHIGYFADVRFKGA